MTKQEFKICEAVELGLTHYYMGPKDKHEVTEEDRRLGKAYPDIAERIHQDVRILRILHLEKKIIFFRSPIDNTLTIMYI
jgi:plasmid stabilization system protein ParE